MNGNSNSKINGTPKCVYLPISKLNSNFSRSEFICTMTSLRYGRVFCLESQKIDGTEYLRGSTDFAIFFILLNLEA